MEDLASRATNLAGIEPSTWTAMAQAIVWAEPRTIAHLVWETVTGQ